MTNKPLLSIIIATRNRVPYCKNVIKSILSNKYTDFELIIQDNSETLYLEKFVKSEIHDPRLRYRYTPPPFSSIDNFNAAIERASGRYLCLIGDDDGINPEIFKITEWADKNSIDAIVPEIKAMYWWPDACQVVENLKRHNGLLKILKTNGTVRQFSTKNSINELMKSGGQNYLYLNFPKLYHGILRREFMDKIKEQTGYYVGGLSPDIYIAVALTTFIKTIIRIDYPLTIAGVCVASTSADSAAKKDKGRLEDTPHFRDRGKYDWSNQVPKFYSGINIWADSAIASLRDFGKDNVIKRFNVFAVTNHNLKAHSEYRELILDNLFINCNVNSKIGKRWCLKKLFIKQLYRKFSTFCTRVNRKVDKTLRYNKRNHLIEEKSISGIEDIFKATTDMSEYLATQTLTLDDVLKELDRKYSKKV